MVENHLSPLKAAANAAPVLEARIRTDGYRDPR
jgi:hypothetical protein